MQKRIIFINFLALILIVLGALFTCKMIPIAPNAFDFIDDEIAPFFFGLCLIFIGISLYFILYILTLKEKYGIKSKKNKSD